jgi:hypothetical protein
VSRPAGEGYCGAELAEKGGGGAVDDEGAGALDDDAHWDWVVPLTVGLARAIWNSLHPATYDELAVRLDTIHFLHHT